MIVDFGGAPPEMCFDSEASCSVGPMMCLSSSQHYGDTTDVPLTAVCSLRQTATSAKWSMSQYEYSTHECKLSIAHITYLRVPESDIDDELKRVDIRSTEFEAWCVCSLRIVSTQEDGGEVERMLVQNPKYGYFREIVNSDLLGWKDTTLSDCSANLQTSSKHLLLSSDKFISVI